MRPGRLIWLFILASSLWNGSVAAQPLTDVVGVVREADGAAVEGARVTLERAGRTLQTTTSDAEGRYRFVNVSPGRYRVRAELTGFAMVAHSITVSPGATITFNLVLVGGRVPSGTDVSAPVPTHARVTVFYATDRDRASATPVAYGSGRSDGALELGTSVVRVPRDHKIGVVERPTIWTLWRESPDRHFVIEGIAPLGADRFYQQMRATIDKSAAKQAFVFVHGFNVTFESAVYRTAQIAYDLGFDGAPILYSWPSEGRLLRYPDDLNNNDWTVDHLKNFLEQVSARSGAKTVHLIAHSMGNRALLHALARMGTQPRAAAAPRFSQIALTAPDIDADEFRQLAAVIKPLVARATLYASSNDLALLASSVYQGFQRAGDTRPSVVVLDGVDTIDVSAVDSDLIGHFYYGDNRSVITDLFYVLQGAPPSQRATLRPQPFGTGQYWIFQP